VICITGLGNPGGMYEKTRHNAGQLVLDSLLDESNLKWSVKPSLKALLAKGQFKGRECVFVKPTTYMNVSGQSVGLVLGFFKIPCQKLIVIHDDLDMTFGKVKHRCGGGHGGHNGIRSTIEVLGSDDFHRIKLGIGRDPNQKSQSSWVLGDFDSDSLAQLKSSLLEDVKLRLENILKTLD
jgi:PTH1 family peptidyl-tRNA hydrolase